MSTDRRYSDEEIVEILDRATEAPAEDAQEQDPVDTGLTAGRTPGHERIVPIRGGSQLEPGTSGQEDAPPCMCCGSIMTRAGACYVCGTCGESGGCG
jgi:hypothetical protein